MQVTFLLQSTLTGMITYILVVAFSRVMTSWGRCIVTFQRMPKLRRTAKGATAPQIVSLPSRCWATKMCECTLALGGSGVTDWTCQQKQKSLVVNEIRAHS